MTRTSPGAHDRRQPSRSAVLHAVPSAYVPPRDRNVLTITVPCPTCGQPVNERCISLVTGQPTSPHGSRRRMALRKEREDS